MNAPLKISSHLSFVCWLALASCHASDEPLAPSSAPPLMPAAAGAAGASGPVQMQARSMDTERASSEPRERAAMPQGAKPAMSADTAATPHEQPADDDAATPEEAPGTAAESMPRCVTAGMQGAFIGDSYITGYQSPALQPEVDAILAREGLVTGYANFAIAGAGMGTGGIAEPALIPHQFDSALAASSDIRLVIMDGGGADWLLPVPGKPDCKNMVGSSEDPQCQAIVIDAVAAWVALMRRMADAGVRDVIFFGLPHFKPDPMPGDLRGTNPNEMIEFAHPLERQACDDALATTGTLRCHHIDLRKFHDVVNFSHVVDGSHPSQSAQQTLAREIYAIMKDHCLGQSPSSGCCGS